MRPVRVSCCGATVRAVPSLATPFVLLSPSGPSKRDREFVLGLYYGDFFQCSSTVCWFRRSSGLPEQVPSLLGYAKRVPRKATPNDIDEWVTKYARKESEWTRTVWEGAATLGRSANAPTPSPFFARFLVHIASTSLEAYGYEKPRWIAIPELANFVRAVYELATFYESGKWVASPLSFPRSWIGVSGKVDLVDGTNLNEEINEVASMVCTFKPTLADVLRERFGISLGRTCNDVTFTIFGEGRTSVRPTDAMTPDRRLAIVIGDGGWRFVGSTPSDVKLPVFEMTRTELALFSYLFLAGLWFGWRQLATVVMPAILMFSTYMVAYTPDKGDVLIPLIEVEDGVAPSVGKVKSLGRTLADRVLRRWDSPAGRVVYTAHLPDFTDVKRSLITFIEKGDPYPVAHYLYLLALARRRPELFRAIFV